MTRRGLLVALVALPLVAASARREYLRVHDDWTRELKLYRDFRTALIMRATLLEPPMRTAMAAERLRLVQPSPDDQAAFVDRMNRDGEAYHEVVFTADSSYDNADRWGSADGGWSIRLVADGHEETLLACERVRKPTPLHQALYTQVDIWASLWIARFERTVANPGKVEVIVGSGYGNGTLTWDLR
jgi:hypothetical protein